MKTIILLLLFLVLTSCTSTYQTITPTNIEQITKIDNKAHAQSIHHTLPCLYGKCICDRRLIVLNDSFEESITYFYKYAHIR